MQILRSGISVHARRQRWRVVDARAYDDCQLITLSGLGPANFGVETRLLAPFDSIEPLAACLPGAAVQPVLGGAALRGGARPHRAAAAPARTRHCAGARRRLPRPA